MAARVQPYPFHRWPKLARSQARLLSRAARSLPCGDREAVRRSALQLLGCELRTAAHGLDVREAEAWSVGADVGVRLQRDDGAEALVLLDPTLAGALVDRALGGDGSAGAGAALAHLDDVSRGALAYVAARLCHAWAAGWRLLEVLPRDQPAAHTLARMQPALRYSVNVQLGEPCGAASVWLSARAVERHVARPAPSFAWLKDVELTLVARAGLASLAASDAAALQRGDIVILDRCTLAKSEHGWRGDVELCFDRSLRTAWLATLEAHGIRLREGRAGRETPEHEGTIMADERNPSDTQLQRLAGDAPVEVSVELARFSLPLEALAELRSGEVLLTGRHVGEQVTLRAGGRALAYGELVDVEGEVGVRVVEVAAAERDVSATDS